MCMFTCHFHALRIITCTFICVYTLINERSVGMICVLLNMIRHVPCPSSAVYEIEVLIRGQVCQGLVCPTNLWDAKRQRSKN